MWRYGIGEMEMDGTYFTHILAIKSELSMLNANLFNCLIWFYLDILA